MQTASHQALHLDVKTLARERGAHRPRHPLMPPAVLAFTRYWMRLSQTRPPRWSLFHMIDVQDIAPYVTVLRCDGGSAFTVEFMGSAVATMLGEDLTGTRVTQASPTFADIDWFERCRAAIAHHDVVVSNGSATPKHTSRIDFVAADYPFMDDAGVDVSRVVALTVATVN
ncbi:MAG: hypothetical protein SFV21_02750 [Rhodospirillaceae bacterium]|nr:hypothetical protein [Rhodospirillaceae bacterium]